MKKIAFIFAAMFTMVQMYASSNDATTAAEAVSGDNESTYQHTFKDDDESTKHWSLTTSGFYLGMGVKHSFESINNSFEIGLLNVAAVQYNSLHGQVLSLGAGIHHRSYSMKGPHMLMRESNSKVVIDGQYPSDHIDKIKNRSSNLNMWTIQFPLIFKQKIVKKLDLGIGGILNWNMYARVDNHYEMDKVEYETKYKNLKQNKINFDLMGSLTWNDCGFYCRYSPNKFFKDGYGPEIKNTWTIGLVFGL